MKNSFSTNLIQWIVLCILIVIIITFFAGEGTLNNLKWNSDPGEIAGGLLVKMTIIAALLDQIIFLIFPDNSSALNESYLTIKDCNHKRGLESSDEVELLKEIGSAEKVILEENKKRLRVVQLVAFGIGLFLAISGVHILSEFVNFGRASDWRNQFLGLFDIISTAALLSGGTAAVEMFFQIIRKNIKTRA